MLGALAHRMDIRVDGAQLVVDRMPVRTGRPAAMASSTRGRRPVARMMVSQAMSSPLIRRTPATRVSP